MRVALVVFVVTCVSACGGSSVAPSEVSSGQATNIAGTWNGTMVSSNNATAQVRMMLTQSGSDVSGTWDSTSVSWEGQISGAVSGSLFSQCATREAFRIKALENRMPIVPSITRELNA